MDYYVAPKSVSLSEMAAEKFSWSPSSYRQIIIPNSNVRAVRDLLDSSDPFTKGIEPGSIYYLKESTHFLIRTKAIQEHSSLIYPKGDAIIPVNPRIFSSPELIPGDILLSKDSNVGQCVIILEDRWNNYMFSGGVVRLNPAFDRYFLFAFLNHPLFRADVISRCSKGATIRHAKSVWLDCQIPLPSQPDEDDVINYVSTLTQIAVEKEGAIRTRHEEILAAIEHELLSNQTGPDFNYQYPTLNKVLISSRLDTGLFCPGFLQFKHVVENYKFGSTTLGSLGIKSRRGPNLAVSVIGKSLYSKSFNKGWYEIIRPVNIGEYGTLICQEWLGTPKELPTVNPGDIVLGCEGFEKGRSIVIVESRRRCTTNFHGTVLYWPEASLTSVCFIRCFLAYLRECGVVDWVGVGGSGGHMSPTYFEYLPIPKVPASRQRAIANLYHSPDEEALMPVSISKAVEQHRERNKTLGIVQLESEWRQLTDELELTRIAIINGDHIVVPKKIGCLFAPKTAPGFASKIAPP